MPHPQRQIVCDKGRLFSRFGERDHGNTKSSNQGAQVRGLGSGDWVQGTGGIVVSLSKCYPETWTVIVPLP
jgi:hypothetical protein